MAAIRRLKTLQIGADGFMGQVHPEGARYANAALVRGNVPVRYWNHTVCCRTNNPDSTGRGPLDLAREIGGFDEQFCGAEAEICDLIARGKFDLVRVLTPDAHHQVYAVEALKAGAHVICEKSLAHTVQAGKSMVVAADGSPGKTVVAYNYRGMKAVQRFKQLVADGRIFNLDAKTYHAVVKFLQDWGYADRTNWRFQPALAGLCGVIADLGGHVMDCILWCLGCDEVVEVSATTQYYQGNDHELVLIDGAKADHANLCVDGFSATLHMKSGSSITVESNRHSKGEKADMTMELYGCYGNAKWSLHDAQWLGFYEHTRRSSTGDVAVSSDDRGAASIHHHRWVPGLSGDFSVGHGEQDLKFATWLADDFQGPSPVPDFYDAYEKVLLCEAIRRAGISHQRVTIDSVRI